MQCSQNGRGGHESSRRCCIHTIGCVGHNDIIHRQSRGGREPTCGKPNDASKFELLVAVVVGVSTPFANLKLEVVFTHAGDVDSILKLTEDSASGPFLGEK